MIAELANLIDLLGLHHQTHLILNGQPVQLLNVASIDPGEVVIDFNFRFSTESTPESLQSRLQAVLERHDLAYVSGTGGVMSEQGALILQGA